MVKSKLKAEISADSLRSQAGNAQAKVPIPTEILDMILEILKVDGKFKALSSVARASKMMYGIAIPKIYETVVVNEKNRSMIGYGHGSGASVSKQGHGSAAGVNMRKDNATGLTRRLVFDVEPDMVIPKSYRNVHEVVIGPQFLINARRPDNPHGIGPSEEERLRSIWRKWLHVVTSVDSLAASLHIQVHLTSRLNYDIIGSRFRASKSAVPTTWEFFGATVDYGNDAFAFASRLQAVVHFDNNVTVSQQALFDAVGWQLGKSLLNGRSSGPFFLCGIPRMVMSAIDLDSANDIDEAAMTKLYSLVSATGIIWPEQIGLSQEKRLEFLKSRVKLVKAGFRPSPADMVNTGLTSQNLGDPLVLDDPVLVPDEGPTH